MKTSIEICLALYSNWRKLLIKLFSCSNYQF